MFCFNANLNCCKFHFGNKELNWIEWRPSGIQKTRSAGVPYAVPTGALPSPEKFKWRVSCGGGWCYATECDMNYVGNKTWHFTITMATHIAQWVFIELLFRPRIRINNLQKYTYMINKNNIIYWGYVERK